MAFAFGPGTILVPNEEFANQAGLLDSGSGAVLSTTIPLLQSGEGGAVLPNGTFLIGYRSAIFGPLLGVAIYTPNFGLVATSTLGLTSIHWANNSPMASDFASTFYVTRRLTNTPSVASIKTINALGVVGGTTFTLDIDTVAAIGVDQANSTIFYADYTVGGAIKSWNIGANAAGPVIVPGFGFNVWGTGLITVPGGGGSDLIVVPGTSTFLIPVQPINSSLVQEIRLYTTGGTLVRTFPIPPMGGNTTTRLALDLQAPSTYFWARTFSDAVVPGDSTFSTFTQFNLATGAVVDQFNNIASSDTPGQIPVSCPFFAWSLPPCPPVYPTIATSLGPGSPVVAPPTARTLVLDIKANRWFADQYAQPCQTRLSEPGAGVHDQVLALADGSVTVFQGQTDQGTAIPYVIQPPDFTADDPRREKAFGDLIVDVDPQGSAGITAQMGTNNFASAVPQVVIGGGATGRQIFVLDLNQGLARIGRSLGLILSGADTVAPIFYLWEPSFVPKVEDTFLRATDWDDCGYFGAKFVQGVIIEADTLCGSRLVRVEYDNGAFTETFPINTGGLQAQIPYSFQNPFVAHLVRVTLVDDDAWRYYRCRFVYEPMPEAVSVWETQPTSLDMQGYSQEERLLITHASTVDFTVSVTADGITTIYAVPNSGGRVVKTEILEAPNKGKIYQYRFATNDGSSTLRLFLKDSETRHRSWNGGAYTPLMPWGDLSRENGGARI